MQEHAWKALVLDHYCPCTVYVSFTLLKLVRKFLPYFITLLFAVFGHCISCWAGNTDKTLKRVMNNVIRRAGSIVGESLSSVDSVYECRVRAKLSSLSLLTLIIVF